MQTKAQYKRRHIVRFHIYIKFENRKQEPVITEVKIMVDLGILTDRKCRGSSGGLKNVLFLYLDGGYKYAYIFRFYQAIYLKYEQFLYVTYRLI